MNKRPISFRIDSNVTSNLVKIEYHMSKYLLLFTISTFLSFQNSLFAQTEALSETALWQNWALSYEDYRYKEIQDRRFKHSDIMVRLSDLGDEFTIQIVGYSNEKRALKLVSIGEGPIQIFLWSQMHGNETTATMALMDLMTWLGEGDDEYAQQREDLLSKATVHMLPMLNPDGAARFRRRNTQDIDINRDALRLQTPEGWTLKKVRDSLDADWGFNLHDQGRTTSVGAKPASISFLAPAYDFERSINEKRGAAMQLIAQVNQQLQTEIPGQVGRYWDAFEPRAFGDNIQKWGTRTILIESGGLYEDRDKQQLRKLNYLIMQMSLWSIVNHKYETKTTDDYFEIPSNSRGIRDVILKNIQLPGAMGGYLTDLAIDFREVDSEDFRDYYLKASISDAGDLSTSDGYITYDLEGFTVREGKMKEEPFSNNAELEAINQRDLLLQGITHVKVDAPNYFDDGIYLQMNSSITGDCKLGGNPSLLFYKDDQLKYSLVNGYLIDLEKKEKEILEGMKKL